MRREIKADGIIALEEVVVRLCYFIYRRDSGAPFTAAAAPVEASLMEINFCAARIFMFDFSAESVSDASDTRGGSKSSGSRQINTKTLKT